MSRGNEYKIAILKMYEYDKMQSHPLKAENNCLEREDNTIFVNYKQ